MVKQVNSYPRIARRANYSAAGKLVRDEIRQDCKFRCVYCDAHENEVGGLESMTIDHFRPKGLNQFAHLEHEPTNHLWACSPCNNFKGNDWCGDLVASVAEDMGYFDPFAVNRLDYFRVSSNGELTAISPPAAYMIGKLELNRMFLRFLRKKRLAVYNSLNLLEQYFLVEVQVLDEILAQSNLSDLERARWSEERKRNLGYLELIDTLDDLLNGFLR